MTTERCLVFLAVVDFNNNKLSNILPNSAFVKFKCSTYSLSNEPVSKIMRTKNTIKLSNAIAL